MTTPIPDELRSITLDLIDEINDTLNNFDAPFIGIHLGSVNRAVDFVDFNDWLLTADIEELDQLIDQYGLTPIAMVIAGIDIEHASLLQNADPIDLTGCVRYVDRAFLTISGGKSLEILRLGRTFLGSHFKFQKQRDMRAEFIKGFIERFINLERGVEYAIVVADVVAMSAQAA